MKVTCNAPNQLILSNWPWLIGTMLVFFILSFAGIGLLILDKGLSTGRYFIVSGTGSHRLVDATNDSPPARTVDSDNQ